MELQLSEVLPRELTSLNIKRQETMDNEIVSAFRADNGAAVRNPSELNLCGKQMPT